MVWITGWSGLLGGPDHGVVRITGWCGYWLARITGWSGLLGGPDHPEIRTIEGKPRGMGNIKSYHTMLKENFLKRKYSTLRCIVVTMGCNVNNFCGKYWAIVVPKLSGPIEDPDYQGLDYKGTTVCSEVVPKKG